jgi:hypothetical protein
MAYEDIQIPIHGQPADPDTYGVRVRNAILDLDQRLALREAAEELPSAVTATAGGGGTNSIVSAINTWANLPTNGVTAQITNPSDLFNLRCLVLFGAWFDVAATGSCRFSFNITGGVTKSPGPGANNPAGWGLLPIEGGNGEVGQRMGAFQLLIPAGAATVTLTGQAYRTAAVASQVNYPTVEIIPWRYEIP